MQRFIKVGEYMSDEEYGVNELLNNKKFITKSKINSKFKKEYPPLKDIPIKDIKDIFDDCKKRTCKVGNPYNKNQQRHISFVDKDELALRVVKDYFRMPRQK